MAGMVQAEICAAVILLILTDEGKDCSKKRTALVMSLDMSMILQHRSLDAEGLASDILETLHHHKKCYCVSRI